MPILDIRRIALAASLSLCAAGAAAAQEAAPAAGAPATIVGATPAEPARAPRRDRYKIVEEELASRNEADALSLIQSTRPQWLRVRGRSSMALSEQVWVYRNGAKLGGVATLRQVSIAELRGAEYLDGSKATERFGADHGAGAILLTTR